MGYMFNLTLGDTVALVCALVIIITWLEIKGE